MGCRFTSRGANGLKSLKCSKVSPREKDLRNGPITANAAALNSNSSCVSGSRPSRGPSLSLRPSVPGLSPA